MLNPWSKYLEKEKVISDFVFLLEVHRHDKATLENGFSCENGFILMDFSHICPKRSRLSVILQIFFPSSNGKKIQNETLGNG